MFFDEMEMLGFFQSPILVGDLNNDLDNIEKECIIRSNLSMSRNLSNLGGWQSTDIFSNDVFFSDLIRQLQNITTNFAKSIEINLSKNNSVQMWININGYRDSNVIHDHPKSIFSGVYYIKVPKNSGNIKFYHPAYSKLQRDWVNMNIESYNFYNSHYWSLTPIENKFFIFPGWIDHSVEPNLSQEKRISISFNIGTC